MTLTEHYYKEIVPKLMEELKIKNIQRVPRLVKISINMGIGEAVKEKKILDTMAEQIGLITGQKPLYTKAHRAIANFKLRAGMPIGLKVTLRGKRMYAFLQKLVTIVLPRVRDFRGVSAKQFDRRGNLNMGFSEVSVFPEIQYEKLDKIRGLEITVVTTAVSDGEGKLLLTKLGMPFEKNLN